MTALDAGFATAGQIKWKSLRDIFSLLCTGYYLLFANEADEKVSFKLRFALRAPCDANPGISRERRDTDETDDSFVFGSAP